MTDNKPDNTSASGSATQHDKPAQKPSSAPAGSRPAGASRRKGYVAAILILLLIVAALAGAVWYQYRVMHERGDALLSQARQSAQTAQAASDQAAQALALARQQSERVEQMQAALGDAQQHLESLEQALQMLTDSGTDIALINDVDHLVSIAHQQLLLGGNVSNAIIALETAQAQLARANRPSLASLQQAINGDVERLRAVSTVDVNRLSSRIDELGRLVETAPLLIPDDAAPAVASSSARAPSSAAPAVRAPDPADPWWKRSMSSVAEWSRQTWWSIRQDLGSFISVRRVDDAAALLLSPEQAGSLRDKLRLRLMTAQLALLMKQPDVWKTETSAVVQLLQARYDINSVEGHRALRLALQLADTSIHIELPTVANSQNAIQALREEHARSSPPVSSGAGEGGGAGAAAGAPEQGKGADDAGAAGSNGGGQGGASSGGGSSGGASSGDASSGDALPSGASPGKASPDNASPDGASPGRTSPDGGSSGGAAPAGAGASSDGNTQNGSGVRDGGGPAVDEGESPATASARRGGGSARNILHDGGVSAAGAFRAAVAAPARAGQPGVRL